MERRERQPRFYKIEKKTLGAWGMAGGSLVLFWASMQFAHEALRLEKEVIVGNTNVSAENMQSYLFAANQKKDIDVENNKRMALTLMGVAWGSLYGSVRLDRKVK